MKLLEVEYEALRTWISYLNPDACLVSRNTIRSDVMKIHMKEKNTLKEEYRKISNRICLTSDLWTSIIGEGYIALTAYYVNINWCAWGIEKRIFSLTLDNASTNDVLIKTLKSELILQNSLVCDGEFLHIRCCAHNNLIVLLVIHYIILGRA